MRWADWRRLVTTYLRPHRRLVAVLAVALFSTIGLQVATPQVVRAFIDRATSPEEKSLTWITALYVGAVLLQQALRVVAAWLSELVGWLTTNDLRADLMEHCLDLDPGFHETHSPGELIERIDGDLTGLSLFFSQFLLNVVGSVLLLIGVLVVVWFQSMYAGVILTAFALFALATLVLVRRISAGAWERARENSGLLFGFLEERLAGTQDIRSSGAEPYTLRRFYGLARDRMWSISRARQMDAIPWSVNAIIQAGALALAFTVPAVLVQRGSISLGEAFALYFYAQLLIQPLDNVSHQVEALQQAIAGGRRVMVLLGMQSALVDGPGAELRPGALPVALRNVSFGYGDDPDVLHEVSVEVPAGTVLGIVGRTGSGKSTIARLLVRFHDPRRGSIEIDGIDLRQLQRHQLRDRVALVTQEVHVLRTTVRDNLTLFDTTIDDQRIIDAIHELGLGPWFDALPDGLDAIVREGGAGMSAGESQLLSFGRAFLADPSVVILDEASSRLDPATELILEEAVDRLLTGRTGIVIAHRLATLERCDTICVLEHGRVVELGSRADLAADETSRFGALLRTGLDVVVMTPGGDRAVVPRSDQPDPWPSWRYAWRQHRFRPRWQLTNLAGVFLGWGVGILPGIAAKVVFDKLAEGESTESLGWLLWPLALLGMRMVGTWVTSITLQSTNGAFSYANATMIQRNLLRRILELPGGRALPSSPGETVSRFRDDIEHVIWWPIGFNNVIGSSFTGAIAVVVMLQINPVITLGVLLPLASVVAIVELARRRIVVYRRANQVRTAAITGYIGDVFAAVQTVQVANAERRVVERFRELNANRRRAAVRDRLLEEVLKGAFWVVNLGTGVVLIFAGRALQSGEFTVGDLALFVYFLRIFEEFTRDVGGGLTGYRQLGVSYGRMHDLLQGTPPERLVENDEIYQRGPLPPKTMPRPEVEPLDELRIDHLGYSHGIEDVSLTIPRGSFTVVTGRIGAGKTTLLQSMLGLVPATGTIRWNGDVIDDPATFLVPPRTAYTPQVPQLFSETLEDNILLGADGELDEAIRLAVMEDDLEEMPDGLATRIGSRGVRLSGGQIQRTAAARMFVRRPELLVCDDLSSALDVETEAALWARVLADGSRTVLAVSHRRAALQRADQVVVLRDGRVDDIGPLADLLQRCEEMRRLWRLEEIVESDDFEADLPA